MISVSSAGIFVSLISGGVSRGSTYCSGEGVVVGVVEFVAFGKGLLFEEGELQREGCLTSVEMLCWCQIYCLEQ